MGLHEGPILRVVGETDRVSSAAPEAFSGSWRKRSRYERFSKPVLDVIGALVLLVVSSLVLVTIALALRATMGSPVLFKQERVGRNGVRFTVWKFRTMVPDRRCSGVGCYEGPERRVAHKTPGDPRVTRLGYVLRKWSLDELPQLWNILRGQMSLVGPRPELVSIVERYEPWQHQRHVVKPGLTGLWQISARGNSMMHERVDLDIAYIRQISFKTDCLIMLRTLSCMMGRHAGY